MDYFNFIIDNRRLLTFGFLFTWLSSFGQTFFIGLYNPHIMSEFGLSHGSLGVVYSLATLTSAINLIWLGRLIDKMDLSRYSIMVTATLAAACIYMGLTPRSIIFLFLAPFSLRLSGQGLMSHLALTSMARYFHQGGERRSASPPSDFQPEKPYYRPWLWP